ncbi:hypothetical protein FACS1894202_08680 [Clostridia bacterium]|nr:hypothetical protein FACS1894202_08660 [Clostridia bacterium]GHU89833.1 hypothetical protein FACS1894202_08680 [Clostridia bacterium]
MKRVLSLTLALALILALAPFSFAYNTMGSRVYDDFERSSLGVEAAGNTGTGTEPDSSWLHNPDGYVVYWIQYSDTTKLSIEGGALKYATTGDGWAAFGMVGTEEAGEFLDPNYDSFIVRLKGAKGGEESSLYFNIQGAFTFKWDNARDPDGNPLPAITTEYKDYVISLAGSGMGATKAQRNIMAKGWSDFHINSPDAVTVYIDKITQLQTRPYTDPVAPAVTPTPAPSGGAPSETPSIEPSGEPSIEPSAAPSGDIEVSYPATDRDLRKSFLVDDFNRASLLLDPELEIAPGGEFGHPNTDGNVVYWIQFNEATTPIIENGALHLKAGEGGWYGTASDLAFLDEYDCVAFRIKGASGGEEQLLTFNPDTLGSKAFSELVGPDGNPVPAITTEYQTIVVDLVKSGWKGLADGKESYQNIHLNTTGAVDLYIDEIYFLAVAPQAVVSPSPSAAVSAEPSDAPSNVPSPSPSAEKPANSKLPVIIILAVVVIGAIVGIVFLVTRKKK